MFLLLVRFWRQNSARMQKPEGVALIHCPSAAPSEMHENALMLPRLAEYK
jgi:hypothetical protein